VGSYQPWASHLGAPGCAGPPPGIAFVNLDETSVMYQFRICTVLQLTVRQHIEFYLSDRRKAMLKRYL
jgi:hypothetical protein